MPSIADLSPERTFEQGAAFVAALGGPEMAAINPVATPMVYAEAVATLNPRHLTEAEKVASKENGEHTMLVRHQLAERRANWGTGHEDLIMATSDVMGNTVPGYSFEQTHGRPTPFTVATVIEGANEQTKLRTQYVLDAQASGLIAVRKVVVVGTDRTVPESEGYGKGVRGFDVTDKAVAELYGKDPALIRGRNGTQLVGQDIVAHKANTRDVLREVWTSATSAERAGKLAVSTSAIYRFMEHDAAAVAVELGIAPEQVFVAGVPAPEQAMARRTVATYGAEISQKLVSAAYHQQALNTRGR